MTTRNFTGTGPNGPRRPADVDREAHAGVGRAARGRIDREALAAIAGTVTDLSPQRRDPRRRSVSVDGRFVLGLHEESVLRAGIKPGTLVDGTQLLRAYDLDQEKAAQDSALLLLSISPRSQRDIMKKLVPRFGQEVAGAVVDRLVAGGWLDDAEFAHAYIRSHTSYGAHRLSGELARRGVARDVASAAIAAELEEVDAADQAREAAAARLAKMNEVDADTARRRLSGYLARRGFDFATIARVLGPLLADLPRTRRGSPWRSRLAPEEEQ